MLINERTILDGTSMIVRQLRKPRAGLREGLPNDTLTAATPPSDVWTAIQGDMLLRGSQYQKTRARSPNRRQQTHWCHPDLRISLHSRPLLIMDATHGPRRVSSVPSGSVRPGCLLQRCCPSAVSDCIVCRSCAFVWMSAALHVPKQARRQSVADDQSKRQLFCGLQHLQLPWWPQDNPPFCLRLLCALQVAGLAC